MKNLENVIKLWSNVVEHTIGLDSEKQVELLSRIEEEVEENYDNADRLAYNLVTLCNGNPYRNDVLYNLRYNDITDADDKEDLRTMNGAYESLKLFIANTIKKSGKDYSVMFNNDPVLGCNLDKYMEANSDKYDDIDLLDENSNVLSLETVCDSYKSMLESDAKEALEQNSDHIKKYYDKNAKAAIVILSNKILDSTEAKEAFKLVKKELEGRLDELSKELNNSNEQSKVEDSKKTEEKKEESKKDEQSKVEEYKKETSKEKKEESKKTEEKKEEQPKHPVTPIIQPIPEQQPKVELFTKSNSLVDRINSLFGTDNSQTSTIQLKELTDNDMNYISEIHNKLVNNYYNVLNLMEMYNDTCNMKTYINSYDVSSIQEAVYKISYSIESQYNTLNYAASQQAEQLRIEDATKVAEADKMLEDATKMKKEAEELIAKNKKEAEELAKARKEAEKDKEEATKKTTTTKSTKK